MDGDGDLDIVTARCINDGPITPTNQTLLWLENPQSKLTPDLPNIPSLVITWQMHEIEGNYVTFQHVFFLCFVLF